MVREDREWPRFCAALDRSEWLEDPRFKEKSTRHDNAVPLALELDALFASQDWPHWREKLEAARITFGPVARTSDLVSDVQLQAGGALIPLASPELQGYLTIDSPLKVGDMPKRPAGPIPEIGEHTQVILSDAGYSDAEMEILRAEGALG